MFYFTFLMYKTTQYDKTRNNLRVNELRRCEGVSFVTR
jgi:hypothetical protein